MKTTLISFIFVCFGFTLSSQNIFLESAFKIDNAEVGIDYIFSDRETNGILYFSHKEAVPMFDEHMPESGSDVSVYSVGIDNPEYVFSLDGDSSDVTILAIGDNEELEVSYVLATFGKSCRLFFEEEESLNLSLEDSKNHALIQADSNGEYSYSLISAPENLIYKITPYENGTLLSGNFKDSLVFTSPNQTVSSFSNNSTYNGFLLSLDKDGEVQWVHLSPAIGYSLVRTVAVTSDDIIIFPHDVIYGTQFSLIDFSGNTISSEYLQGVSMQYAEQYQDDNIAICGNYYSSGGTADMDFGAEEFILPTADQKDAFLIKYDSELKLIWAQVIGGKEIDTGTNFDFDDDGGIYLTGCIQSDGIFDGGSEVFEANGAEDVFITHYNSEGQYDWTNTFGGEGTDIGLNVIASEGTVVLSGIFRNSMDINPADSLFMILEDTSSEYDAAFFYALFNEETESNVNNIDADEITISPNPANDYVRFSRIVEDVKVYTSTGKLILSKDNPTDEINISKLLKGSYFIVARGKHGNVLNEMIIKN